MLDRAAAQAAEAPAGSPPQDDAKMTHY
jgi:hypothetical protein